MRHDWIKDENQCHFCAEHPADLFTPAAIAMQDGKKSMAKRTVWIVLMGSVRKVDSTT
jgi:hypothetical protein